VLLGPNGASNAGGRHAGLLFWLYVDNADGNRGAINSVVQKRTGRPEGKRFPRALGS